MIKSIYTIVFKTLGTMTSTAKDSFMEGYNNPYKPVEEEVEDSKDVDTARHLDEEIELNSNKSTFIRDVSHV